MIKIFNISKNFKNIEALENISLEVKKGEILGLLGENGAGKSTLLRILSTMLLPTSGTAKINGFSILKEKNKVRKNVGVLFGSEVGLYDRLSARENLQYFADLNGMNRSESKKIIEALIKTFGMELYAEKLTGTFSKGMKQKTAIARAIIHNPPVILFDEPDSGLDFRASKTILDFMENSKKQGKSIIFSSHSMENIKNYSDRIAVLHRGKIIKIFSVKEYRMKYTEREINDVLFDLVADGDSDA